VLAEEIKWNTKTILKGISEEAFEKRFYYGVTQL
jgi:hypothetical protein